MKSDYLQSYYRKALGFVIRKLKKPAVLAKFVIVSGSAVILNLLLLYLLVQYMQFNTTLGENVANAISMEIAIIYNFLMSRAITWSDRKKEAGHQLFYQLIKFHLTIGITILLRLVLFFFLQMTSLHYLLNAAIGIALASAINFVAYDTLIFQKKED